MRQIHMILPASCVRNWHMQLVQKLEGRGCQVLLYPGTSERRNVLAELYLYADQRLFKMDKNSLICRVPHMPSWHSEDLSLLENSPPTGGIVDLTGRTEQLPEGSLQLLFHAGSEARLTFERLFFWVASGHLPDFSIHKTEAGGKCLLEARPMIDNRVSVARGLEDVLARAVSMTEKAVLQDMQDMEETGQTAGTELDELETTQGSRRVNAEKRPRPPVLPGTLAGKTVPRLVREVLRRRKYHAAHWRVGYRFTSRSSSVLQTYDLSGEQWQLLPDDGSRFFADPFPFVQDGQACIFVEDWSHEKKKAVISVSLLDEEGKAGPPQPVLEEPWHLSYPQVFTHDGEIWMLPESSAGKTLVLYKAVNFPLEWEQHAVLMKDCEISDATLLEHEGLFWIVATDRDGQGSTSDMMVVFSARKLEGPWHPHRLNPVRVDRRCTRPGGAFLQENGKIFLPMQDGTTGYGGGLGIARLERLDEDHLSFKNPVPVGNNSSWPYPRIHTWNRAQTSSGWFEVIDGIADVRKRKT